VSTLPDLITLISKDFFIVSYSFHSLQSAGLATGAPH
jgi:hypothetical protein